MTMASGTPRRHDRSARHPRNATGTHQRILDAALTDFAERGFAGARIGRIADRAGINRAMLYYYFGCKRRLFDETVRSARARLRSGVAWHTEDPIECLVASFRAAGRDARYLRLVQWQALEGQPLEIAVHDSSREAFGALTRAFGSGRLSSQKAWLLVSATMFPLAFPNMTEALVGQSPSDSCFTATHDRLIRLIARALADQPRSRRGSGTSQRSSRRRRIRE